MANQSKRSGYFYSFDKVSKKLIYMHRDCAELKLGRPLLPGEVVHHIDENKENNSLDNLIVFKTNGDHVRFHNLPLEARDLLLLADGSYICRIKPSKVCPCCGVAFAPSVKGGKRMQKFCSHSCAAKSRYRTKSKQNSDPKKDLHKKIWDKPIVEVALEYGVSDTAIKKQCIKYGIPRPGRGFWNKLKENKLEGQSCPLPD